MADSKPKASPAALAYRAAMKALREQNKDRFEVLLQAEYEKRGMKYTHRLTADERKARDDEERADRAAARVAALVKQYGTGILPEIAATEAD